VLPLVLWDSGPVIIEGIALEVTKSPETWFLSLLVAGRWIRWFFALSRRHGWGFAIVFRDRRLLPREVYLFQVRDHGMT